jgi:hypothetical protein
LAANFGERRVKTWENALSASEIKDLATHLQRAALFSQDKLGR